MSKKKVVKTEAKKETVLSTTATAKAETKKAEVKPVAEVKKETAEVKNTVASTVTKADDKKDVTKPVKKETVKAEPKKEVSKADDKKKAEPKKETAKVETKKEAAKTETKKTTKKVSTKKVEKVVIQYYGKEFDVEAIKEAAKADYIANGGKKTVKSVEIYVKPEDNGAYYVIDDVRGFIVL